MLIRKKLSITVFLLVLVILLGGRAEAQVYSVETGDTLFDLSLETGIPMDKIKQGSFITSDDINAGQVLLIPKTYIVKPEDTLFLISQRYGIELWELQYLNNLYSDYIVPGQSLYIPEKSPYDKYTVQGGDSIYLISKAFGVDIEDLKEVNGLLGNGIYPGMVLLIPTNQRGYQDSSYQGNIGYGAYYTRADRDLLARLIHAEAEGEPYLGKVAVGAVVVNRVNSDKFPNTIKNVIYQVDELGCYQFSPVLDGRLFTVVVSEEAKRAADEALAGIDPSGGALFFFNPWKITNQWLLSKPVLRRIGDHVFTK